MAQNATYVCASGATATKNVTPGISLRAIPNRIIMKARDYQTMKLMNYDREYLIMQNVKSVKSQPTPNTYTKSQYKILCNLIQQKRIKKPFFNFIISGLFEETDWKKLNYQQMYQLIHTLTFYDYGKGRTNA